MDSIEKLVDLVYRATLAEGRWAFYLEGIGNTLLMAAGAAVLGVFLGIIVAIIKTYSQNAKSHSFLARVVVGFLNWLSNVYTTVIRGTPVVVQLLIVYYMVFTSATRGQAPLVAAFAFGINSGAYVSEIIRAGINSIDRGQMEAGRSLGLSQNLTMRLIILPQAIKNILPALFNEFIVLLKETSVAGWIAVLDITRAGDVVRTRMLSFAPLLVSAGIYLVLVLALTKVQQLIERRLAASDRG